MEMYNGTLAMADHVLSMSIEKMNKMKELGLFGLKELPKEDRKNLMSGLINWEFTSILDCAIWFYQKIIKPVNSSPKFVEEIINEFLGYCINDVPTTRRVVPLYHKRKITGFVVHNWDSESYFTGPWKFIEDYENEVARYNDWREILND